MDSQPTGAGAVAGAPNAIVKETTSRSTIARPPNGGPQTCRSAPICSRMLNRPRSTLQPIATQACASVAERCPRDQEVQSGGEPGRDRAGLEGRDQRSPAMKAPGVSATYAWPVTLIGPSENAMPSRGTTG